MYYKGIQNDFYPEQKPSMPYLQPDFYGRGAYTKFDPTYYMNQFMNNYNQNRNDLTNLLGQWNGTNAGNAGLGMYDLGNAGMGLYDSALLGNLTNRVNTNLTNPNASLAMGLAKDQMAGSELGQRQALADRFAGWGRGSGIRQAAESGLNRDINKTASDTYRQIAMDTEKQAIADAQALEGMKGGFMENALARELQNRTTQGGFYDTAKARELQNAGLNKDMLLGMGGLLGGDTGQLTDMLKWEAGINTSERDKYLQQLLNNYEMKNQREKSNYDAMSNYNNAMYRYNKNQYYKQQNPFYNPSILPGGGKSSWNGGMW